MTKSEIKNSKLINNITFIMKARWLTQDEVARSVGLFEHHVGSWQEGRCFPNTDQMKRISDTFKVSIDDLVRKDISKVDKEILVKNYRRIENLLWTA